MSTCTFEISFTSTIWRILISWDEIHSQPPYTRFVSIYFALSKPIKHTLGGGASYICVLCAATQNPQVCFYQIINTSQHTQSFSLPNSVKLPPWEEGFVCLFNQKKNYLQFWHIQHMELHGITWQNKNSTTAVSTPNSTKCSGFGECSKFL